jgi:hypothetical protein
VRVTLCICYSVLRTTDNKDKIETATKDEAIRRSSKISYTKRKEDT